MPTTSGRLRLLSIAGAALCALVLMFSATDGADVAKPKLSDEAVKKELTTVVESQLAAFRTNDFKTAYTFAASSIKEVFALPAFEQMVKTGYPVIANSESATFGVVLDDGEQAVVNVAIKGKAGRVIRYQYMMIREGKLWKITGVAEQKAPGEEV